MGSGADLTGIIPARRARRFRPLRPIWFPRSRYFSRSPRRKRRGTFVPRPDCFHSDAQCGSIAPIPKQKVQTEVGIMLSWVITFLVIALIAGVLGFGGIAGVSIEIAKTIFF